MLKKEKLPLPLTQENLQKHTWTFFEIKSTNKERRQDWRNTVTSAVSVETPDSFPDYKPKGPLGAKL